VRAIDLTHATGANRADDFIGAEVRARGKNQRAEYTDPPRPKSYPCPTGEVR
jgi:hypothetical protein